jgi:hypothetical protein
MSTKNSVLNQIISQYGVYFTRQIQLGKAITARNDKVKVIFQNGKQVDCINLNIKQPGIEVVTFFDRESSVYYAWGANQNSEEVVVDFIKQELRRKEEPLELAIAYAFGAIAYYNFYTQDWHEEKQTLELNRVYDFLVAVQPIAFNQRRIYTANIHSGFLEIKHDIDEHYDIILPYHRPTLEICRFNPATEIHDGALINGNGGAMDGREANAFSLYGFYTAYLLNKVDVSTGDIIPNDELFKRIGGWRHWINLDTAYIHNAVEYQENIYLDHVYQSSITGQAMRQVMTTEYTAYEILPSFTDKLYIAIWDCGVNGKPTTDYYAGFPGGYPPIQSRFDPHTWHKLSIDLSAYMLGLGGLDNFETPIYLDFYCYFPDNLANLNINAYDTDKFLVTIKGETIQAKDFTQTNNDNLLMYNRNLEFDFTFNAQYYGLDASSTGIGAYTQFPHGRNTYLVISYDDIEQKYVVIGKQDYHYPDTLIDNNILMINNVDDTASPIEVSLEYIENAAFVANYLGAKGVGYHKFNSQFLLDENQQDSKPFIDKGINKFYRGTNVIPAGYQSVFNNHNKYGTLTVLSKVYNTDDIVYGLEIYQLEIENFISEQSYQGLFLGNPSTLFFEDIAAIVPQFYNFKLNINNELDDTYLYKQLFILPDGSEHQGYTPYLFKYIAQLLTTSVESMLINYYLIDNTFIDVDTSWDAIDTVDLSSYSEDYELNPCYYNYLQQTETQPDGTVIDKFYSENIRLLLIFPYLKI